MYTPFLFSTSEQELHYVLLHKKATEAFPLHWHDEIEISLVLSGELNLFLNGECLSVKAGNAVFINSGDCHYYLPEEAEFTCLLFSPDLLSGTPGSSALIENVKERIGRNSKTMDNWKNEDRAKLRDLFSFLESLDSSSFSYSLLVRSAIFRIVAMIADDSINPASSTPSSVEFNKVRNRISDVFRYIEEHYMEPLSLPEAAAASGYVPTYFSRVFKTCTGMTFYDYLTVFRIRKAEMQLTETNDSIAAVAAASGFSSVKTFDRVFKEQLGISPLKFRKQYAAGKTSGRKKKIKDGRL